MSDPTTNPGSPAAVPLAELAPGSWALDGSASSVTFTNKSMWGLVTVKGVFSGLEGQAELPAGGAASGTVTIDAASVDTKHKKRDIHLRSADFFEVEAHPSIVFTAARITPTGPDTAEVAGDLTVRGTTKPLSFTARAVEASADAVTLTADLAIDRADFGMTWSQFGMKPTTNLTLNLRFTRR